jgi:cell division protein FtsQ
MRVPSKISAISILLFVGLVYLFAWSPLLSVKSIAVIGAPSQIPGEEIIRISQIKVGEKLARIEPRSIETKLSELSWVNAVAVDRNWWSGDVEISLTPRIPVGIFQGRAIDQSGTLFDLPGKVPTGLPVVSASSTELGLEAIALFTSLPNDLRDSLLSIGATNASAISSWQQFSGRKVKVMWGSRDELDLKVSVYRALLQLPENKAMKRMDLSAPHAPIVK